MIIFDQIKFTNWIPFYGLQEPLVFSKNPDQNITLVMADNQAGKTAILRGIQWCMFGDTNDSRKYKNHLDRLNKDAAKEKIFSYSIELKLLFNNIEYKITRSARVDTNQTLDEKNFIEELVCNINGQDFGDLKAQKKINEIFDINSSRFYLFDGEMLNEYEDLLTSNNMSSLSIKIIESIEDMLKITPLRHASKAMHVVLARNMEAFEQDETNNANARLVAEQITNLDKDIEALDNEKKELEDKKVIYESQISEARNTLTRHTSDKDKALKLDDLINNKIPVAVAAIKDYEGQLSQLSKSAYLGIIEGSKNKYIDKLKIKHEFKKDEMHSYASNKIYRKLVDNSDISSDSKKVIESYMSKSDTSSEITLNDEVFILDTKIKNLEKVNTSISQLPLLTNIYATLSNVKNQLILDRSEKDTIESTIGKEKSEIINKAANLLTTNAKLVGEINNMLNIESEGSVTFKLKDLRTDKSLLEKSMPINSGNSSLSSIAKDNSNIYKNFFNDAISKMVSMSKEEVENMANKIYDQLKEYREIGEDSNLNLKINESYGMEVKSGDETLIASAGGSQIVALSLILSLRNILEAKAPILMDTPLARLDKKFRKGVLGVVPKYGTQFILLAHDGEIEPNGDLDIFIRPNVGKKYKLIKKGDNLTEIKSV
tara:strand:+ start:239 stop:2212 length:1974 start_codon:yes stop_codon:yes gene_type:complete